MTSLSNPFALLDEGDGSAPKRAPAKKKEAKPEAAKKPARDDRRNARGSRGPRHNNGSHSHGRGGRRGGKREYDRRSGTGRGREVSKGGKGGQYTWEGDDSENLGEGPNRTSRQDRDRRNRKPRPVPPPAPSDHVGTPAELEPAAVQAAEQAATVVEVVEEEEEVEPEPEVMSYDEFLAAKAANGVAEDRDREIRGAEINDKDWKNVGELKKEEVNEFAELIVEKTRRKKGGKKKKQVISLDEFTASGKRGGNRGGRDGQRRDNRGPRGAGRGGRNGQRLVVNDSSFPALGGK